MTLHTADFIILGLIGLSILIGLIRGLIKESISLISWAVAITLAMMFVEPLSQYMTFTQIKFVRSLLAFLLIFVGTIFIGAILNFLISSLIKKTPFKGPDRILGSVFGLFRGMAFVSVLVLLAGLTPLPETPWWKKSYVISRFQVVAIWLKERLPEENAKVFQFHEHPVSNEKLEG